MNIKHNIQQTADYLIEREYSTLLQEYAVRDFILSDKDRKHLKKIIESVLWLTVSYPPDTRRLSMQRLAGFTCGYLLATYMHDMKEKDR